MHLEHGGLQGAMGIFDSNPEAREGICSLRDERHKTILHYAAEAPDVEALRKLLKEGSSLKNLDAPTVSGMTPLLLAAASGGGSADEAVRLLLQHAEGRQLRKMLKAKDEGGLTAFSRALRDRNFPMVLAFLEFSKGEGEAMWPLLCHSTLIHHAAATAPARTFANILDCAPNREGRELLLAKTDESGLTPLQVAAVHGNADAARCACQSVSDKERRCMLAARNGDGWTAFRCSLESRRLEIAMLLIEVTPAEERLPMLHAKSHFGENLLHLAAGSTEEGGTASCWSLLALMSSSVSHGGLLGAASVEGWTPLQSAVPEALLELVHSTPLGELLGARDCDGCTPFHRALERGRTALSAVFLALGAPREQRAMLTGRDTLGQTILHHLADIRQQPMLEEVLAVGLSLDVDWHAMLRSPNAEGWTPLQLAASKGNMSAFTSLLDVASDKDCSEMLLQKIGDATAVELAARHKCSASPILHWANARGKTLLHFAVESFWKGNVHTLLRLAEELGETNSVLLAQDEDGRTAFARAEANCSWKTCDALLSLAQRRVGLAARMLGA